jgi:uncharacterized membrane protein
MLPIVIVTSSFAGLALASYIHVKKRMHRPMVCPIGSNCDTVIHSKYSKVFDIPVELLGALYYTITVASYSVFMMYPSLQTAAPVVLVLCLSIIAFLFSIYLTAVQAFVLKEWCTWCLISAALCTTILIASIKILVPESAMLTSLLNF